MRYLIEFGVQGATELHVLDQVGALTLVRGDDADLVRFGSSLQQPGGDLLYVGSLRPLKRSASVKKKTVLLSPGKLHPKFIAVVNVVVRMRIILLAKAKTQTKITRLVLILLVWKSGPPSTRSKKIFGRNSSFSVLWR